MVKYLGAFLLLLNTVAGYSADKYYVFYLHGAIVEGTKSDPFSGSFGRYEYSNIIKTLKEKGYVVFSEVRPANTNPEVYALKIAGQVDSLKKAGVAADRITVIGASKGAVIAMLVSGLVKDKHVKYVVMAACNDAGQRTYNFNLYGQVLSIYERSDDIGKSCDAIKKASDGVSKYKEIELNTGKRHGFIYRPIEEWLSPATAWIDR